MSRNTLRLLAIAGALCVADAAHAAPRVTTYSSLCWEHESGDASGFRIVVTRSTTGDTLQLEWTDGPLEGPTQAQQLEIGAGGAMTFAIPLAGGGAPALYQGRLLPDMVILDPLPYGGRAVVRRVRSGHKKIRHCRD